MEITYLGHSCFKIVGKKISILCDPYRSEKIGLKLSKQDADVVTVSHNHDDHNNVGIVKSEKYLLVDSPGEYEIKDTEFVGVDSFHDEKSGEERGHNTMFSFEVDGVKLCHLGDLGTDLSSAQLDKLDGVDIVMIPVGGVYTIDPKVAVKVISQLDPKIVIPMHYKDGQTLSKIEQMSTLKDFLHEMSVEPTIQDKLKVTIKDLPEKLEVVTLKY